MRIWPKLAVLVNSVTAHKAQSTVKQPKSNCNLEIALAKKAILTML